MLLLLSNGIFDMKTVFAFLITSELPVPQCSSICPRYIHAIYIDHYRSWQEQLLHLHCYHFSAAEVILAAFRIP